MWWLLLIGVLSVSLVADTENTPRQYIGGAILIACIVCGAALLITGHAS